MTSTDTAYTGADNLEVMREALNYNAWLLALVRRSVPAGGRVLDFGAGCGTFALPLQQGGLPVTCLEPDGALGAILGAQGMSVVQELAQLEDSSFDLIYSLNVLEHVEDDRAALAGLLTKLKPGGRLLLYVPAFQVLFTSMDRKVGHIRRYHRNDLVAKARQAGFWVDYARYADSIGFFAALTFRMLDNGTGSLNPAQIRFYDRFVLPVSLVLDRVLWPFFGKNLHVLAQRRCEPATPARAS